MDKSIRREGIETERFHASFFLPSTSLNVLNNEFDLLYICSSSNRFKWNPQSSQALWLFFKVSFFIFLWFLKREAIETSLNVYNQRDHLIRQTMEKNWLARSGKPCCWWILKGFEQQECDKVERFKRLSQLIRMWTVKLLWDEKLSFVSSIF